MTCLCPLFVHRSDEPNENGKYPIEFGAAKSIEHYSALQIPCGKCEGCVLDKSRIWSIRMYHEMQLHDRYCFVTLTYADDCQRVIDKVHCQQFLKRLRYRIRQPLRYFLCGEYGEQTRRPHYHMVLYGADFLGGSYKINESLYGNKILDVIWGHGNVVLAPLSFDSICYVAGYVCKKLGASDGFQLMSRKPGIGKGWLDKYKQEIVNNECVVIEGVRMPIPAQYMKWYEREFEEVKDNRRLKCCELSVDELAAKRANIKAKLKLNKGLI